MNPHVGTSSPISIASRFGGVHRSGDHNSTFRCGTIRHHAVWRVDRRLTKLTQSVNFATRSTAPTDFLITQRFLARAGQILAQALPLTTVVEYIASPSAGDKPTRPRPDGAAAPRRRMVRWAMGLACSSASR
jgi:hypothetical protein